MQRDATRGERIADDVLAEIKGTTLDRGVVLDELARVPQAEKVAELAARGPARPAPGRDAAPDVDAQVDHAAGPALSWRHALFAGFPVSQIRPRPSRFGFAAIRKGFDLFYRALADRLADSVNINRELIQFVRY